MVKHLPYTVDERRNRFAFYENHWKRVALDLVLSRVTPAGCTWLDYGCGRGEMMRYAADRGFTVRGTDLDPTCLELSRAYGEVTPLDPENPLAQFGARSHDIVSCLHVLEHVDNPRRILSQIGRIARRYVVVAVPNLRNFLRPTARTIDLSGSNEGHLQSWDHWHFLNLATRHCGLRLVQWGFDATLLPFISQVLDRGFGPRAAIWFETKLFRRLFPFHGISVLGLFEPAPESNPEP